MKPRLILLFLCLVLIPLGLLAWLGIRMNRDEQLRAEAAVQQLHREQLKEYAARMRDIVAGEERRLLELAAGLSPAEPDRIREMVRTTPGISQVLITNGVGGILHPPQNTPTNFEQDFLQRLVPLFEAHPRLAEHSGEETTRSPPSHGWHHWYYGSGVRFLFWHTRSDGNVVAFEIPRAALLAKLLAALPSIQGATGYRLLDMTGYPLYTWGAGGEGRTAAMHLDEPLAMWSLEASGDNELPGGFASVIPTLVGIGVVLVLAAALFYRESNREMQEAMQKVSFVNQVSHELKTPLTNIRLYAELLEHRIEEEDTESHKQLKVVVNESARLSRLINNVLHFARRDLSLSYKPRFAVVDDTLREIADQFSPVLEGRGIALETDFQTPGERMHDPDLVCQVVGNLLSNVEKYAAEGGWARLSSRLDGTTVTIAVEDHGLGILPGQRERIFRPFYRVSDKVSDGVAGTGIGLTISRKLAELHGGGLAVEDTGAGAGTGARFLFTLQASTLS